MIELLRKRRSIRKFSDAKIDGKPLLLLQEALLRAPSSRAIKPCEFIFVDDTAQLLELSHCKARGATFLADAPLGIVICGDESKSDVWVEDCSIASIFVQLTGLSLGLGSCWIQIRNRLAADGTTSEAMIRTLLGIPDALRVLSIIALGYPEEEKGPVREEDLDFRKIHFNGYKIIDK
jgi:nitroreductase